MFLSESSVFFARKISVFFADVTRAAPTGELITQLLIAACIRCHPELSQYALVAVSATDLD